jgi:hypothetical protein
VKLTSHVHLVRAFKNDQSKFKNPVSFDGHIAFPLYHGTVRN